MSAKGRGKQGLNLLRLTHTPRARGVSNKILVACSTLGDYEKMARPRDAHVEVEVLQEYCGFISVLHLKWKHQGWWERITEEDKAACRYKFWFTPGEENGTWRAFYREKEFRHIWLVFYPFRARMALYMCRSKDLRDAVKAHDEGTDKDVWVCVADPLRPKVAAGQRSREGDALHVQDSAVPTVLLVCFVEGIASLEAGENPEVPAVVTQHCDYRAAVWTFTESYLNYFESNPGNREELLNQYAAKARLNIEE